MWPKALPDANLIVEKAKHGDIAAFEALYTSYVRSVYSVCLRFTKDNLDAEDLTQEVFLQVYRKLKTFRGEAAFGSWLYRVAINASMMYLRKRTHVDEVSLDILKDDVYPKRCLGQPNSNAQSDPLDRIALLRALSSLSKGRRNMVILHDIKGLTHDEIAAQTGVTANTSKSTLSRARRKLRDALTGANTGFYEQERSCNAPSAQLSAPYGEETSVMDVPFGVNIAHTPEVANFVNGLYAGKFASSG